MTTAKFIPGNTYSTRSACDHDCIFAFTIIRRTERTIWTEVRGRVVSRRVNVYGGVEQFMPFGNYSMAATIRAA